MSYEILWTYFCFNILVVYLKFRFNWASYILSSSPKREGWLASGPRSLMVRLARVGDGAQPGGSSHPDPGLDP